jgi:hypothetical protein
MFIGTVAAAANGAVMPLLMYFFTNIIDGFTNAGKLCDLT